MSVASISSSGAGTLYSVVSSTGLVFAASTTSSCVECGTPPPCPQCASDEYCLQTAQTCSECSTTRCVKKDGSSTSSLNGSQSGNGKVVGGIVGGVVGGIVLVAALLLFYLYHRYWKKALRKRAEAAKAGTESYFMDDNELDDAEQFTDSESEEENTHYPEREALAAKRPPTIDHSDRHSTVTVQTRASNILPIAYIPGVTSGFRGLNTAGDVRSHITLGSSILGGIEDEEDTTDHNSNKQENLTTAIRARPKLVQIQEEEIQEKQTTHVDNQPTEQTEDDDNGSFILNVAIGDATSPFQDKYRIP
ncbi:hypothetical protein HG537_0B02030 [Torulaspora globosa]|uniref:Membrane anchor Opy2 N-terminal domain-containing protein n=1 Tax=Torulaspora globosa TaxID=48254 RepID=A0A7H9HR84_9SACH|nr:hypothetical protein HG537_0B02030 [Torulaspora sp. CBS 2947]